MRGSGDALEMGLWEGEALTPTGSAAEDLGVGLYFIHPHLREIRSLLCLGSTCPSCLNGELGGGCDIARPLPVTALPALHAIGRGTLGQSPTSFSKCGALVSYCPTLSHLAVLLCSPVLLRGGHCTPTVHSSARLQGTPAKPSHHTCRKGGAGSRCCCPVWSRLLCRDGEANQLSWNKLSSMGNWGVLEGLWLEIIEWLSLERTS